MATRFDIIKTIAGLTEGKIFSVTFTKKDGTVRDMVCRTGVHKNLTGCVDGRGSINRKANDADHSVITVFDMQKNDYRRINAETVTRIKVDGVEMIVK